MVGMWRRFTELTFGGDKSLESGVAYWRHFSGM